jgi:hypothetical protein
MHKKSQRFDAYFVSSFGEQFLRFTATDLQTRNHSGMLRHTNLKVRMETYVQAMSDEKRKAQSKVVEMIMPCIRKTAR